MLAGVGLKNAESILPKQKKAPRKSRGWGPDVCFRKSVMFLL